MRTSISGACFLLSHAAFAQPAVVSVARGVGAETCIDEKALIDQVNGRIGRDAAARAAPRTNAHARRVHVEFERDASGYRANIRVGERERRLEDPSDTCDGLGEATVLSLAVLLQDDGASPPVSSAEKHRASFFAGASGGVLGLGEVPLQGAVEVTFIVSPAPPFALTASVLSSTGGSFEYGPGTVRLHAAAAHVGACGVLSTGQRSLSLSGCGALLLGRLQGEGEGYWANRSVTLFWVAPAMVLRAGGPIAGPLEWWASAEGWVSFSRPTLSIDGGGVVYRLPTLVPAALLGVGVHF